MGEGDILLLVIALGGIAAVAFALYYVVNSVAPPKEKDEGEATAGGGVRRRGGGARRRANRQRDGGEGSSSVDDADAEGGNDDDDDEGEDDEFELTEGMTRRQIQKQMKKKEKADMKRAAKTVRDDKAKREGSKNDKYRKKEEERERKEKEKRELQQKADEERKTKEEDDFNQWKDMFAVEGEGVSAGEQQDERQDMLIKFLKHIKEEKLVILEDLAALFGLTTTEVIERLNALERMTRISGVIDDRGKFIHVTEEEMSQIASFIQRRGRVSVGAIAKESNNLVDLNPTKSSETNDDNTPEELSHNINDVEIVSHGLARKR